VTSLDHPDLDPARGLPLGARPLQLLILGLAVSATTLYLLNEDFWWYLACGRAIVEEGRIPGRELFLYPIADESVWLWHSWGWTVLVAVLHDWGGLELAMGLGTVFAAAMVYRIFTHARLDRLGLANTLLTLLVFWAASRRLSHKSEIVTWCLFAFYLHAFDRRARLTWRWVAGLVLVQLIWSNTHGGYLLGHALLLAFAADRAFALRGPGFIGRAKASLSFRRPAIWLAVGFVGVLFASPTGLILRDHAALVLSTSTERAPQDLIQEFKRTFAEDLNPGMRFNIRLKYLTFLGLGAASFAWTRSPRSTFRFLVFAGMAVLGHRAMRFVHGFGIASVLITMSNLASPAPWVLAAKCRLPAKRATSLAYPMLAVLLGVGILGACVGHWIHRAPMEVGQSRQHWATVDPETTCPGAATFILDENLPGPIFNDMALGGYLIHRLYPTHQLFIDSRNMSYDLLREYLDLCTSAEGWRRGERKYGFRTVVLGNLDMLSATTVLRGLLAVDPSWSLVYLDPQAAIFRQGATDAIPKTTRALDIEGRTDTAPFVFADDSFARRTLRQLGRLGTIDERAFFYRYVLALKTLGKEAARWAVTGKAIEVRPAEAWIHLQRAESGFNLGDYASAVSEMNWLLAQPDRPFPVPELLFYRASAHAALGQTDRGLADLRALKTMQPDYPGALALERELSGH